MMFVWIVDLLAPYVQSGIFSRFFNWFLLLAFVATVPCIIRYIVRR